MKKGVVYILVLSCFIGKSIQCQTESKCLDQTAALKANEASHELTKTVYEHTHPKPSFSNLFGLTGRSKNSVLKAIDNLQKAVDAYEKAKSDCINK